MAEGKNRNWTRDEAKLVLALYCQIPFGKMHSKNPDVVLIAQHIGRTPAAVALKLVNFASMDPQHQKRGVGGMKNASTVDREIWADYFGRWDELAELAASTLPADALENSLDDNLTGGHSDVASELLTPLTTDAQALVKIRKGQAFFRRMVLAAYDNKCCITGIATPQLLRASHIIPWSKQAVTRLDPHNGLSLNALHDTAFDQGLLTIRDDLSIQLSNRLPADMPSDVYHAYFHNYADKLVAQPQRFTPKREYLAYHREMVFVN